MNLHRLTILLFLCFLPLSCIVEEGIDGSSVQTVALEPRRTSLDQNAEPSVPVAMVVSGSALIMPTRKTSKAFQVVPLPLSGETFLAGDMGRGPMDFQYVDPRGVKAFEKGFLVHDMGGYKRCHLEGKSIVVDSNDKTWAGEATNGFAEIKSGYIDIAPQSSGHEFVLYTKAAKVDKYISKMPDFGNDTDEEPLFLYMKQWAVKPDGKYIAAFYGHFDRMKIMDISGKIVAEKTTDFGCTASASDDISRRCYNWVSSVTDKYIPALHRNAENSEIQVWDWSGNLLKRFIIPDKTASFFAVDWPNNKLYYVKYDETDAIYEADFIL